MDNEIQILITAVDNCTATLQNVQKSVGTMSTESVKQTQAMSDGFQETTGQLLVIGRAAQSVDSIFNTYQNTQLRLENATERVANAQDRLKDAQYNLSKVQADSKSTAEDIAHAEDQVERASRALTISQNNLTRAHNAVIGSYISIGVQVVSLIASMPTLWGAVVKLTTAMKDSSIMAGILDLSLGPLLLTLGLIAAAIALVVDIFQDLLYLMGKREKAGFMTDWVANKLGVNYGAKTGATSPTETGNVIKLGDFISRPGQAPVSFSPDDTIIASKGGMTGTVVNITGPIYGVSAQNLSRAIAQELGNKLSL